MRHKRDIRRKTLAFLLTLAVCFSQMLFIPAGNMTFAAEWAPVTEEIMVVVTGTGIVDEPGHIANEKSYTRDELLAKQDSLVHIYSTLNSAGTKRIYKAKGVLMDTLFEATAFTPDKYNDFSVTTLSGDGSGYAAVFNPANGNGYGLERYYFPHHAAAPPDTGDASPVPTMLAFESVSILAPASSGAIDGAVLAADTAAPRMIIGQTGIDNINNSMFNQFVQKVQVGDELPAILRISGKNYTRADLLLMPRYNGIYTYPTSNGARTEPARGTPLLDLLVGYDDNAMVEFITADDYPNAPVTVAEVRDAGNEYLLAYEKETGDGGWSGIYDTAKNNPDIYGFLTVYAAGKSPVKMVTEIKVTAPAGSIDFPNSPYKHINNGGLPGSGPYNIDVITGATLTVEGPALTASVPVSVRQVEEENAGLFRGDYTDYRPAATTLTYEGLKLSHILYNMGQSTGIRMIDSAYKVVLKNRWRHTIAEFTLDQIKEADAAGKPVIIAYGTSTTDDPPSNLRPFQYDGRLGIDPALGNGDGCIKLVYDKSVFSADPNPGYTKFGNMAYIYVEEDDSPGFKHNTAPYDLPENTRFVVTVTGDKIGREVNYTVEQLEAMVEYGPDGLPTAAGMGYRAEYSLANSNYWYVHEYEGVKLWALLQKAGLDQSEMSALVKFRATDGYTDFDEFTLEQISDPDLFGYYQKNPEDDNTGAYVPKLTPTNPDNPEDPEWVSDLLDIGYPVLVAYGVNKYPYVIDSKLNGFKSGLGNDAGPVRIISGKTNYHHANGSKQAKLLDKIIVGNEVNYSTHKSNPGAGGVYQALADNVLRVSIVGDGGEKIKEVTYKVSDIEEVIYGAAVSNLMKQAAVAKDFYGFIRGGNTYTDLYEGVKIKYFLENVVQIPGSKGVVEFKNTAGTNSVTLTLEDLYRTGKNSQTDKDGLSAVLAFAKNGYPMVSGSGSAGYVSSYTDGYGQAVTVANSNGPLAFTTPEIDGGITCLADVGEIIITIAADKFAHIGAPYDALANETLTIAGEGTRLDAPREFTLADLEGKQNLAYTADYSIKDTHGNLTYKRYRGIDLYDFLRSTDVGLKASAAEVIIKTADGAEVSFSLAEVMKRDYLNTGTGADNLRMLIAYGSAAADNPDREDGKPLVRSTDDPGYNAVYGNSGGPLQLVTGQTNPDDANAVKLLNDVVGVTVTAGEMTSFNHSSNDTYKQYLDEKYLLTIKETGTNAVLFEKEYTLAEIEANEHLIVSDEYSYVGVHKEEGIDLWKFVLQEAGHINTVHNPIRINVKAGDGYEKNIMEFGLDALQNGITDGAVRKIIILSYATSDKPLVPSESSPGYNSGNSGGPLRLITHNNQGACLKDARTIEIIVNSPVDPGDEYDFVVYPAGEKGLPYAEVRTVVPDNAGGLWIGTYGGGAVYLSSTGEMTGYNTTSVPALRSDYVVSLAVDDEGGVWFSQGGSYTVPGSHQGAAYLKNGSITFYNYQNTIGNLANDFVQAVAVDSNGLVWFGNAGGLSRFNPVTEEWASWAKEAGIPAESVDNVAPDNKGGVWLTTYPDSDGGLSGGYAYVSATGVITPYNLPAGLDFADYWSRSIAIDPSGGVYIVRSGSNATTVNSGGMVDYIAADGTVTSKTGKELIPDLANMSNPAFNPEIRKIAVDAVGGLWLGTSGLGLYRGASFTNGAFTQRYSSDGASWPVGGAFDNIWSIRITDDGVVCVGSNGGAMTKGFVIEPVVPATLGDVNNDGVIDDADVTAALNHYLGAEKLDREALLAADVDKNGKINYFDVIAIQNHYLKTKLIGD